MRRLVLLALAACSHGAAPAPVAGSAAPAPADEVTGTWHGTSTCLVKPSACHDEEVVYHFTAAGAGWSVAANKIVNGTEEPMGDLSCTSTAPHAIRCPIPNAGKGDFLFTIDGDRLTGELVLTDGTKFRTIAAARVR